MDDLDYQILQALQDNGRIKKAVLARQLDVPTSTLMERLRRLERNRIIQGYMARIDPRRMGLAVQGFISISLDHHQKDDIRNIEYDIQQIPYVRACYHVAGRFDYLLHVAARNVNHLSELVKSEIASIPGIGKIETFIVFAETKTDGGWPILRTTVDQESSAGQRKNHKGENA